MKRATDIIVSISILVLTLRLLVALGANIKRVVDIAISATVLFLTWHLLLLIALAVKLTSAGPVFYGATRIGKDGKPFKMYKFRTMVVNADKIGPAVTGARDPRITRVGLFLRKTKLDELPQLINVLRGDMSLVGPRPEDPRYVALYTPEQQKVLKVRPGITSPASVRYRDEASMLVGDNWEKHYVKNIMPAKLNIDLEYAEKPTIWRDAIVVMQTVQALLQ